MSPDVGFEIDTRATRVRLRLHAGNSEEIAFSGDDLPSYTVLVAPNGGTAVELSGVGNVFTVTAELSSAVHAAGGGWWVVKDGANARIVGPVDTSTQGTSRVSGPLTVTVDGAVLSIAVSGGGGVSLPEYGEDDAGKVLAVAAGGESVEWVEQSGGVSAFAALSDVSFADAVDGQHAAIHDGVIVPSGPPWTITERGPLHLETVRTITAPWGWVTEGEGDVWEPDTPKWDPVTGLWVLLATGGDADDVSMVGGVVSADGEEWEPISPGEPLFGPAEDPNLVRALDGTVWRDSAGRAWCLCEEMGEGGAHRGIELWRSDPNLLTGWTSAGRVIDRGGEGEWDEQDRTSPTGQHDGDGHIVVLFEGRDNPTVTATGGIGRAVLDEAGALVSVDAVPLISPGVEQSWFAPDDVVRVGDAWVVLAHGTGDGQPDGMRRFLAADDISDWTPESFTECSAELFLDGDEWGEAVAPFGVDPTRVTVTVFDPLRVIEARVVSGEPTVDLAALEQAVAAAQQTADDAAGAASAAAGVAGSALSAAGAAQSAVTAETSARVAADGRLAVLVARFASPEPATGTFIDLTTFMLPGYTALDGASDLDIDGGATLVPVTPSTGNAGAALVHTMPPDPVVPPVTGAALAGVVLRGVTVTGGLVEGVTLSVSVTAAGEPPPLVAWVSAGSESAEWTRGSDGEPVLVGPQAATETADVVIVADGAWFGVAVNVLADDTGLAMPTVQVDSIDWLWQVPASAFT